MITKINFVASANSTTKKPSKRPTSDKFGLKKGRSSALFCFYLCVEVSSIEMNSLPEVFPDVEVLK